MIKSIVISIIAKSKREIKGGVLPFATVNHLFFLVVLRLPANLEVRVCGSV